MTPQQKKAIVLRTLDLITNMIEGDANALIKTRSGDVSPEQATIELIREVLDLAK